MNKRYGPVIEAAPDPAEVASVRQGLSAYNSRHVGEDYPQPLVILLRADDDRSIGGGLLGESHWGWLYVAILWVREDLRHQGYGQALLAEAEREAARRGCPHVYLDTMSFQARPFYERLGYHVFGELPDMPPGHCRYFLRKDLNGV